MNVVRCIWNHFAYLMVKSLALDSAAFLLDFHSAAASLFKGSSGLGSASRLWMESRTDFICSAGDQFFLRMSRQILPKLSKSRTPYRYWGGKFWCQRPPLEATSGNHRAEAVRLWICRLHSKFPEGLSKIDPYLVVQWRNAYNYWNRG